MELHDYGVHVTSSDCRLDTHGSQGTEF